MPRVLLTGFCAVPGPRRAGVQLRHVIRSLSPSHTVDLLVVREGEQAYVERQGSVRVLRVPSHDADLKSQILAFQRALKRQLDGADYDVVHCRDGWSGIPVLEARARMGYAVVYDLSRSPVAESTLDPELDAQYGRDEEACILASDMVLAPTPAAVKALQGRGKPERVMLSPPGVDVDRFDWEEPPASGPPRIIYAGSIDPSRGVRVLVRAMAAIVREADARLVLAGPAIAPKFEIALRDGIRELGLSDKVEILGVVDHDQLPSLLASATVCVVPAAADLTPNPTVIYPTKLLEYMACKRAIVAPKRETISMVVENGREALLFEPGDPVDLARKVLRLLGDAALRERIASAAYDKVRRDFTASGARRALRTAYEVIVERFAEQFSAQPDEAPKVELLADDDFEATVFEEPPQPPPESGLDRLRDLESIDVDIDAGNTSSALIVSPLPRDETAEHTPARPPNVRPDTDSWTHVRAKTRAGSEEWFSSNVAAAVRSLEEEAAGDVDDGTPIEGVAIGHGGSALVSADNPFVAGEIDVPTPPAATPAVVELSSSDVDTGSQPPVQRRSS